MTKTSTIKIGTRGSKLALWQAEYAQVKLKELGYDASIHIIKTKGDKIQHLSFDKIEGKGFFTKEIEDQLLEGKVDLAVHSMKDLTTTSPPGLVIAGVSYREDPSDALLIRTDRIDTHLDFHLSKNAKVGTSSMRRKAQLKDFRPDIETVDIRGNVQTRLRKLFDEDLDAIMLASAGLDRVKPELKGITVKRLHPKEFVPAPAQGVLAYQTLETNKELRRIIKKMHNSDIADKTNIERGVLKKMEGGCLIPLGVYCEKDANHNYHVWAAYAPDLNTPVKRFHTSSSTKFELVDTIVNNLR